MTSKEDLFAELFGKNQHRLYGFVFAILRNTVDAQDVVQQTACTAWTKFADFDPNTDFFAWTVAIAKYEAFRYIRYRRTQKLAFDQETVDRISEDMINTPSEIVEEENDALADCVKKLTAADAKLIECRYEHGLSTRRISELLGRSQASVCNSLKRIRGNLLRCIRRQIASEDWA